MRTEKITFKGHSGEALAARLDLPDGTPKATAIFAHCFTCTKDIPIARRLAHHLANLGTAVLRFDFTGLGSSEGDFADTTFTSNVEDLRLAAQYLCDNHIAPTLLIGHSLGGAAVLRVAPDIKTIRAVATIGAPADPAHVVHNFGASVDEIKQKGAATLDLAGREFTIKKEFIDDVEQVDLSQTIGRLNRALLVLHSPIDQTVGIENAAQIFAAAKHPKSFITLDQTDHLVTKPEDAEYIAQVIGAWSARYLHLDEADAPQTPPDGVVRSNESDADGFLQDIYNGNDHHVLADEPVSFGGSNKGMSPFGFLSAALAACTSMTIRMYARHKGWALEHVSVDVKHDKIPASPTEELQVDHFVREVTLVGDLDADQRAKLLEIANKCPVHRTMESQIVVKTTAV